MRNTIRVILFLNVILILVIVSGCAKPSENDIPSYIAIDTISLKVNSMQGTASQKVTDSWVYADNDLIGAFELPSRFPVLKSGTSTLSIFAGIKLNGINETRVPYPFYDRIQKTVTLKREEITDLGHLTFYYAAATKFAWLEDFEQVNLTLDSTARSEVNFTRARLDELEAAFPGEGNDYAAKVVIAKENQVFESVSHNAFVLPTDGTSAFLELNYKTNNPFTVGLVINGAVTSLRPILVINPSSKWNKIYINLTPTLASYSGTSSFKVYFTAVKSTNEANAEIFFDNIKLLHF